jgi:hypothetical protein
MKGDEEIPASFSWARRWSAGLNLVITIAAVLALVAMFNYLSIRHFTRFHWNRNTQAELSGRTHQVLAALTNTVKVIVYFDSKEEDLFPRVKGLLKEYQFASPRIQVQYVDYLRDGTAARKVKQDYKLATGNDKDVIIFDADGRSVVVNARDLSDYDISELTSGKSRDVYRTHFKGELLFTSKIYAVANARATIAYHLIDHGEHPDVGEGDGYGRFYALLRDENNFDVRSLRLVGTNEVPGDCSLLIIAGPTTPLATVELDRIQRYLVQGGRALIAFNQGSRRTGLEKLLGKWWGVEVGENVITDRENAISTTGFDVVPVEYGSHQIVHGLRGSRVLLYMPRSIRAQRSGRSEESKVDELLFTGPKSLVITDLRRREVDPTQTGPQPLMAVVEKSVPALQRGSTRIAVIGDSFLWGNNWINADANGDFAAATANWLVNQSVLLSGIPPRPLKHYKLTMTQSQLRSVQLILMAGVPSAVLFLGLLVWFRRRH